MKEDNPQYRYDYLDDMIATIGKGTLGLTLQCARCHNHKFDPILQRDYYAMQASLFGYVETPYPLAPKEQVDAHDKKVAEIDAKQAPLRAEIRKIEAPYRERLRAEAIKRDFPLERPAGGRQARGRAHAKARNCSPTRCSRARSSRQGRRGDDAGGSARRKALDAQINALDEERPEAVAGGRHRDRWRLPLHAGPGHRGDGRGEATSRRSGHSSKAATCTRVRAATTRRLRTS